MREDCISPIRRIAAVLCALLFAGALGRIPGAAAQAVKIGVITSLTGTNAVQGQDIEHGIRLAVERINAGYEVPLQNGKHRRIGPGLLGGRPIRLIVEDTESLPASAMDAVRKLVNVDHVSVVLGGYSSGLTLPTGQFTNANSVVQIGIGSTSPALAGIGPYFFNAIGLDNIMGAKLAEFALQDSGAKRFTSITPDNPFGVGLEIHACQRLQALGGTCINTVRYALEKSDYRPEIRAAFRGGVEAGLYTAYGTESRLIFRQLYELGKKPPMGWYADYPTMWANEIARIPQGVKGLEPGPSGAFYRSEYASAYRSRFGSPPTTAFGAYGYDAAMLAALAIEAAGSSAADSVKEQLPAVSAHYKGITGDKTFDARGMQKTETYQKVIFHNGKLLPYRPHAGAQRTHAAPGP